MFELIRANRRRAAMLVVLMGVLLIALGWALGEYFMRGGGPLGVSIALVVWFVQTLVSYFAGDSIILQMNGARKLTRDQHPVLFNVVEEMCIACGLASEPEIYVVDDDAMNAFATGRDPKHAVVAVTSGLLKALDRDELQGVIGHEISHVANRDVLYMTMLGVMMGTIILLGDIALRSMRGGSGSRTSSRRGGGGAGGIILIVALVLIILSPILAQLLYAAVSRRREYLADACSAQYTRFPEGLARALEKLQGSPKKLIAASPALAPMYIVNPLEVTAKGLADASRTHPPISERIKILRSMGSAGFRGYDDAFRKVTHRPVGVVPFAALAESKDTPVAAPAPSPVVMTAPDAHVERVRQVTNLMWALNDYMTIECECGTKLKIPPAYKGKKIECPQCGRVHVA